ncbi:MAG: hypothetical protein ABIA59_08710 [Candidatus Latescibacterota bacterium]
MKKVRPEKRILLVEMLGFLIVIVAIWVDEAFHLPHHLFGAPMTPFLWREAIWESVFVLVLGLAVVFATRRNARRIAQLESLLPICMVCKKIRKPNADPELDESWQTMELYINERTGSQFSHGLCPECALSKYGISVEPER